MSTENFLSRLAAELQVDAAAITPETVLADLPEYDSMARLAIMAMAGCAYGAAVSADDLADCTTAADLMALIERQHGGV